MENELQKVNTPETQTGVQKKSDFSKFMNENWVSILALIYVLSPIDIVPEALVPVIGYSDDFVIVVLDLARRWYLFKKKSKVN